MNIFKTVKEAVSVMDAAYFYGQNPHHGKCRCPFHNDHTPSMLVDERYYCFGCGATGDVIDYVSKLFNLPPKEAALRIASDFGINIYDTDNRPVPKTEPVKSEWQKQKEFDELVNLCIIWLDKFKRYWEEIRDQNMPDMIGEWNDTFTKAINNIAEADMRLEVFTFGTNEEKHELIRQMEGQNKDA